MYVLFVCLFIYSTQDANFALIVGSNFDEEELFNSI